MDIKVKDIRKIIVFGAVRNIQSYLKNLNRYGKCDIVEIWDNNEKLWGTDIVFENREIKVTAPKKQNEYYILIATRRFEHEIMEQLINKIGIDQELIKNIKDYNSERLYPQLLEKYKDCRVMEIQNMLSYIKEHPLDDFNDGLSEKNLQDRHTAPVEWDQENRLWYSYWCGKKIYLKRELDSAEKVRSYLSYIKREQDLRCAHCYRQFAYKLDGETVVLDAGAAEGFFSLECVDIVKKIYIVEGDPKWVEALRCTFEPYNDKVNIIQKWLGEEVDATHISIDAINDIDPISLIKMDIEGAEQDALKGASHTFAVNGHLDIIACAYHRHDDEHILGQMLLDYGCSVKYSDKYMIFMSEEKVQAEFRHALVFGKKEEKKRVFIWGAGQCAHMVYEAVDKSKCMICGLIDRNAETIHLDWITDSLLYAPDILQDVPYDYVIISAQDFEAIRIEYRRYHQPDEKLVSYWDEEEPKKDFINYAEREALFYKRKQDMYERWIKNATYEYGKKKSIKVESAEMLLRVLMDTKASLCRFGDGELGIMCGIPRPWFQRVDDKLSDKLRNILQSNEEGIVLAIADDFGNLEKYTEEAADEIRKYVTESTRQQVQVFLDPQKRYYDAYVSRPYLIYQDKTYAQRIFSLFKELFNERELLIVEGRYTRNGVGNNLLETAKSVRRIICPAENAYDKYREIYAKIKENYFEGELVLITLGPTATVLAYDLAMEGIQAIDLGQLDIEYEWYIRGVTHRVGIPGKTVAEVSGFHEPDLIQDEAYEKQIVAIIL